MTHDSRSARRNEAEDFRPNSEAYLLAIGAALGGKVREGAASDQWRKKRTALSAGFKPPLSNRTQAYDDAPLI